MTFIHFLVYVKQIYKWFSKLLQLHEKNLPELLCGVFLFLYFLVKVKRKRYNILFIDVLNYQTKFFL